MDGRVDWGEEWKDVLQGNLKWKRSEAERTEEKSYHLLQEVGALKPNASGDGEAPVHILIPLAGDSIFTHYAWTKGHSVTAVEFVEVATQHLQKRFQGQEFHKIADGPIPGVSTSDKRAQIWNGNFFTTLPSEVGQVDVVHDKDSFGAIPPEHRETYLDTVQRYIKVGGHVLLEARHRPDTADGPPYHIPPTLVEDIWIKRGFTLLKYIPQFYATPITMQAYVLRYDGPQQQKA